MATPVENGLTANTFPVSEGVVSNRPALLMVTAPPPVFPNVASMSTTASIVAAATV